MRAEVRPEMCAEVRCEGLSPAVADAGRRLLAVYAGLAQRGEHLFARLLAGAPSRQWRHYPQDDAVDAGGGYQWFYHSHAPGDRPGAAEHGHIHLFARKPLWTGCLRSRPEARFRELCGASSCRADKRHLVAVGFDAKGVPISLFTVNGWVTGDSMLGAPSTLELLDRMALNTGHSEVDAVIEAVAKMCAHELACLMSCRDEALRRHAGPDRLSDRSLEVLSEISIDVDAKLRHAGHGGSVHSDQRWTAPQLRNPNEEGPLSR